MSGHGVDLRDQVVPKGRFNPPGRFGRMFPHLRSLKVFNPKIEDLGKVGGPMDGAGADPDNDRIKAGFTFLGQFIDHDVTFDPTSSLEKQNDPHAIRNFRTPALELDSVYGAGPGAQPFLYDATERGAFLISADNLDVPRTRHNTAIIGDPRNDENLIVSQIHLAIMKFHNEVLRKHAGKDFEAAQTLVRWHYQWIVLHEFLPLTCGEDVVTDILKHGRKFFRFYDEAFMPVEFSVASYRFGHSQVRPFYRINDNFAAPLFPDQPDAGLPAPDLRGSQPVTAQRVVAFKNFFGAGAQLGKLIDRFLNSRLLNLPDTVVGPGAPAERRSLAIRNLVRGKTFGLPAGQTVACYMGIPVIKDADLWKDIPGGKGLAPLWFYTLREAELKAAGKHLHGAGARIVAEVLIGLLEGDKASFLSQEPDWKPTLPSAAAGKFEMTDLLKIAGVP